MKSKRQIQKESTRQKIMDTAYRIYAREGFSASTAKIAREAGVSHGTVFAHFQSLNELLECMIGEFQISIAAEFHEMEESSKSISDFLDAHLKILIDHEDFYLRLITERSLLPEEVQYVYADNQAAAAHHFNRMMTREMKNGAVKEIPVHMLFNTWLGLIHYYLCNKEFFSPDEPVLARYSGELKHTFLSLITK
ncbi:TetR/AcrR family transcriptional regulator [Clostridium boliviensis]|uniref:TetR/AcrR family transcriptional regulator n=1 Tax=Clostridium boliviensis TaxID=318465 RepID=A0ABU4GUD2_9CLOT|nr:TetR/AcrR family transcriptional regulator [Clostridium boliviensis]MDW2800548.1 TetR/AcrR family transcriptional regulator [Clostridium boliviensis]